MGQLQTRASEWKRHSEQGEVLFLLVAQGIPSSLRAFLHTTDEQKRQRLLHTVTRYQWYTPKQGSPLFIGKDKTPCMIAIERLHLVMLQILLSSGASPFQPNKRGEHALHALYQEEAPEWDHEKALEILWILLEKVQMRKESFDDLYDVLRGLDHQIKLLSANATSKTPRLSFFLAFKDALLTVMAQTPISNEYLLQRFQIHQQK